MDLSYYLDAIKYHFIKNKKIYILFFVSILIGVVVGVFITLSTDWYSGILSSANKILLDYIKGNISFAKESSKLIINILIFQVIIFVLNLNFYSGLASFVLIGYQGALLYLSIFSVIFNYGFLGILISLLMILPINFLVFFCNIIYAVLCLERSYGAMNNKQVWSGFNDKTFWIKIGVVMLVGVILSLLIVLVLTLLLRLRIFIIF